MRHPAGRWFGVILLPLISFSGDATVAAVFFMKTVLFLRPEAPESLAKGRAIDLSIQFMLFWMPFLVLLGWWTNKPLTLLFGGCCPVPFRSEAADEARGNRSV